MALKPVFILLLWGLTFLVHDVTSSCNVICSTDYTTSLNCSCSGSAPTYSVLLEVKCSDGDLEVNGTCEVKPPRSWCIMYPEMFDEVTAVGTECTAAVRQGDQVNVSASDSSSWELCNVVKPQPPSDVQVANAEGFYNITWDHSNQRDCLTYTVRVRESKDLSKEAVRSLLVEEKHLVLDHKTLQPHVNYTVDVKAKMCPGKVLEGPWSEWSPSANWRTSGPSEGRRALHPPAWNQRNNGWWWYVLLSVFLVIGLMLLGYLQKPYLQKRFQLITYIPKPDEFFKPLYHNYEGNFKEWVKPAFSEYDYLRISSQVQMKSERPHDVLQWNNENQSYAEDNETKQGAHLLHMLQPHSNSLLFFQDGGSSQGTSHSTGHISIHTVTLSGEEEFEEEAAPQNSVDRSYQDGESFGSFGEDSGEQAGYDLEEAQMSRLDRQSGVSPHHENQISNDLSGESINFQPRVQLNEERVSLDSFASNEQSEDGYPHVDLDTIDSGFGECSSPGASDSNIAEQIDSVSFHEHKISNSNYVKQWMVCSTIQEDTSNLGNELHQAQ